MDKQLLKYSGSKSTMTMIALLTLGQGVAVLYQAVFLSAAITDMFKGAAWTAVLPFLLYFGVAFVIRHALQWGKERISYRFAEKTSLELQKTFINRLFDLGTHTVRKQGTGNIVTLCMEGIPAFRTYLEIFIPRVISMVLIPIILLIYVFSLDFLSGLVLFLTMPILVSFLMLLGVIAKSKIGRQMHTFQKLSSHFLDSLRGLVTLKYLGRSKAHQESIERVSDEHRKATMKTLRIAFLNSFSLDFFASLSVAVVAVELGIRLIEGNITLQPALAILILAPEYFFPIRSLGADFHATMDGKEKGKIIQKLIEQAEEPPVKKDVPLWNADSSLVVTNLSKKSNEDERLILKNISFSVQGLKKVGIVGASGAGKSTLIDLLSGLTHPHGGSIQANGVDLTTFATDGWQKQITYIPQHPYIFSGTLAENIKWYKPDATDEEVYEAAKVTGLTELINRLPNGIYEQIGHGGRSLSGGEEQRVALARTLLDNRPIMLFDEPTAHLDIETEHDIKNMLLPLMENKLVFFATHRLHWMRDMDLIFVIEGGSLVESGTHDELFAKKGAYYRLIQAQKGGIKE